MQRDPKAFTGNPSISYGYEADGYRVPASPAFTPAGMTSPKIQSPLGVFEFQPSKVCPRNFIIFDHADDKGRIMYHPALVSKLTPTNTDIFQSHGKVVCKSSSQHNLHLEEESSFKEDSEEIDALLSSDEESDEDDVVSTGRTPDPLDSCPFDSSSPPRFKKMRYFSGRKSSVCHGSMENHENIRRMVTALRGIIPGGDQLDTPALLEEAIRYLKFLKMEAKNLGTEGLDK